MLHPRLRQGNPDRSYQVKHKLKQRPPTAAKRFALKSLVRKRWVVSLWRTRKGVALVQTPSHLSRWKRKKIILPPFNKSCPPWYDDLQRNCWACHWGRQATQPDDASSQTAQEDPGVVHAIFCNKRAAEPQKASERAILHQVRPSRWVLSAEWEAQRDALLHQEQQRQTPVCKKASVASSPWQTRASAHQLRRVLALPELRAALHWWQLWKPESCEVVERDKEKLFLAAAMRLVISSLKDNWASMWAPRY